MPSLIIIVTVWSVTLWADETVRHAFQWRWSLHRHAPKYSPYKEIAEIEKWRSVGGWLFCWLVGSGRVYFSTTLDRWIATVRLSIQWKDKNQSNGWVGRHTENIKNKQLPNRSPFKWGRVAHKYCQYNPIYCYSFTFKALPPTMPFFISV